MQYINIYKITRSFGGPEEGGWHYDVHWPILSLAALGGVDNYSHVAFIDGDEGRALTDKLFNVEGFVAHGVTEHSVQQTVAHLSHWDSDDGYTDLSDDLGAGSQDLTLRVVGDNGQRYVLTANLGLGYVGLSRVVNPDVERVAAALAGEYPDNGYRYSVRPAGADYSVEVEDHPGQLRPAQRPVYQ